eukprot:m.574571 g.574571  ORF g.574571 m.574571 type:complete len:746 (+) comp22280_c0_seq3:282-2519(+)
MDLRGLSDVFKCMICLHRSRAAHICPHCSKICCYNCAKRWLINGTSCPHCRKPVSLEQLVNCRWVDDVSEKLLELEKSLESREVIVDHSVAGSDGKASGTTTCDKGESFVGTVRGNSVDTCPVTGKPLSVYCDDFNEIICHHCALWNKKYSGCTFRDLDDVYSANVDSILSRLKDLRARQRELLQHAQHVEKNADDIRSSYQVIENVALEHVNKLHEDIRRYLNQQLRNKLAHVMGTKNSLTQRTRALEHMLLKVEDELQSSSRCQLVRNSKQLLEQFSNILDANTLKHQDPLLQSLPVTSATEISLAEKSSPIDGVNVVSPVFHAPITPRYLCGKLKLYVNNYRAFTVDRRRSMESSSCDQRDTVSRAGGAVRQDHESNIVTIDACPSTNDVNPSCDPQSYVGYKYSNIADGFVLSDIVQQYGFKWRLKVYPAGTQSGLYTHLSVFLEMVACPRGVLWSLGVPRHEWRVELVRPGATRVNSDRRDDDNVQNDAAIASADATRIHNPLCSATGSDNQSSSASSHDATLVPPQREDADVGDERVSVREYECQFSQGECWGYERFYSLEHLFNDGFIDPINNTLTLSFGVRSTTLFQHCELQEAWIKQLESQTSRGTERGAQDFTVSSPGTDGTGTANHTPRTPTVFTAQSPRDVHANCHGQDVPGNQPTLLEPIAIDSPYIASVTPDSAAQFSSPPAAFTVQPHPRVDGAGTMASPLRRAPWTQTRHVPATVQTTRHGMHNYTGLR